MSEASESKCDLCGDDLVEVVVVAKQDKKNHSCSLCDYTTARKDNLKRHMRTVHSDPEEESAPAPTPLESVPEEVNEVQLLRDEVQELKEMHCALLLDFQALLEQVESLKPKPKEKVKRERKKKAAVEEVKEEVKEATV